MPNYPEAKTIGDLKMHLSRMLMATIFWEPIHVNDLKVGRVFETALGFNAQSQIARAQLQAVIRFADDAKLTAEEQQLKLDMALSFLQNSEARAPDILAGIDRAVLKGPGVSSSSTAGGSESSGRAQRRARRGSRDRVSL